MVDIPEHFRELKPMDGLMKGLAPLYGRPSDDGRLAFGLHVLPHHCNPQGNCHGGTWATMADVLMGCNIGLITGMSGPTVSMALDFIAAAVVGQWVEGEARILRETPRLAFADCMFMVAGAPALRANGVYRRTFDRDRSYERLMQGS